MSDEQLWSPQQAAKATGFHEETIRSWARGESPIIRRVDHMVGRRKLLRVYREDVLREARARREGSAVEQTPVPDPAEPREDRLVTSEEILTRRRIIDEYREEIEELHRKIIAQQREIEILLTSPRRVPNN